jgi:hypothetical protein
MTARQIVNWVSLNDLHRRDLSPENAPAPPSATRHPEGHLFVYPLLRNYAQGQLATIRMSAGQERDIALYELFEEVSRHRLSPTWLNAYQRIAVNYLNTGLGPIGDIACASFLLMTMDL